MESTLRHFSQTSEFNTGFFIFATERSIESPILNSQNGGTNFEFIDTTKQISSEYNFNQNVSQNPYGSLSQYLVIKPEPEDIDLTNFVDKDSFEIEDHKIMTQTGIESLNSHQLPKTKKTVENHLVPSEDTKVKNVCEISPEELEKSMQIKIEEDKDSLFPIIDSKRKLATKKTLSDYEQEKMKSQSGITSHENKSKSLKAKRKNLIKGKKCKNVEHSCQFCQKKFKYKQTKNRHELLHNPDRPFPCDYCNKSYVRKIELIRHLKIHTGEKPFQCSICAKKFIYEIDLKNHVKYHTGENISTCDVCKKTFSNKKYLKNHMALHFGEKKFKCTICNKQLCNNTTRIRHERLHNKNLRYSCHKCDKNYSTEYQLKDHVRIHSNKHLFRCTFCGKQFNRNCDLQTHLKTHTGVNECTCDVCKKKLCDKKSLLRHMFLHFGERTFKCDFCDSTFFTEPTKRRHERIQSKNGPFPCQKCGKSCFTRCEFRKHMEQHNEVNKFFQQQLMQPNFQDTVVLCYF